MDLSGLWHLSDETGRYSVPFSLPGDGVSALHSAGVIPDPYFGRNEYDLRWISERNWVAKRVFSHDGTDVDLVIDGLDTVAEITLNGQPLRRTENAFRRWRIPTLGRLRRGENTIEINFLSPVREGKAKSEALPFFVPSMHDHPVMSAMCPIPYGNMLRKPACDFGWDWNIALASFGIWGDIRLEPVGPRVSDILVHQSHSENLAVVTLEVFVDGVEDGEMVNATLCGVSAGASVVGGTARISLKIANPVLWWPAGQGAQALHTLTVTTLGGRAIRQIGLRDMRLVSEPDAAGRSFAFHVNGRPIFAKGANWIPADALHGRITQDGVRDLLQSAVDANMNMIRVWGGGRYEPDWFYDLCDEMGIMIWQDFMFSCNLYPSTPDYLAEVDAEVRDAVRRINHHACIALWCGDNELIGALGWFEASKKDRDRYLVNYDRLNRTVETALLSVLPDANWWPSSPSPGPMAFGDAWHDDSSGDMHFWSVWHEGKDFDHYRDVSPRFCSEFGFQSYPSMSTVEKFAETRDWNIAAPVMESHQKNPGGNARIAETMFRYFRFPVDFPNFVYLSQVQQGLAIKTAVTHWRSLKPHCMGTLYWQLNDTWPVCSWASLDHGGNWKLLHHMARRFFAPVLVTVVPDGDQLILRAVSDLTAATQIQVTVSAVNMAGQARELVVLTSDLPNDRAVEITRIPLEKLGADEVLAFTWDAGEGNRGGDVHAPRAWKTYDLLPASVSMTEKASGGSVELTLSAQTLAPFVAVEASVPGRFSNNAFTLFPGHPATIIFTPNDPAAQPSFVQRDLHSATYGPQH